MGKQGVYTYIDYDLPAQASTQRSYLSWDIIRFWVRAVRFLIVASGINLQEEIAKKFTKQYNMGKEGLKTIKMANSLILLELVIYEVKLQHF